MKLVKRPGNKFFGENEESILGSDLVGIMDVSVDGERDGEKIRHTLSYQFTDGPNHDRQRLLYRTFGTTMVYVALPAVVGAKMCVYDELDNGLITPDCIPPSKFFSGMEDRGVPFTFEENIITRT